MRWSTDLEVRPLNVSTAQHRRCKSPTLLFFSVFIVTHAFLSRGVLRRRNLLALAPKKSVTLQVRWQSSVDVAPVLGRNKAGTTVSLTGHAPPMVAYVPSVGQAGAGAGGAPLEVAEQPAMEVIPLPMMGRTELPSMLVAPTAMGATPPVEAPPM